MIGNGHLTSRTVYFSPRARDELRRTRGGRDHALPSKSRLGQPEIVRAQFYEPRASFAGRARDEFRNSSAGQVVFSGMSGRRIQWKRVEDAQKKRTRTKTSPGYTWLRVQGTLVLLSAFPLLPQAPSRQRDRDGYMASHGSL